MVKEISEIRSYIKKNKLQDVLKSELLPFIKMKIFKRGEFILVAQEEIEELYFLVDGKVEISSMTFAGTKIFVGSLNPLELLGDLEYVNKKDVPYDVIASKKTVCLTIPFKIIELYLEESYHFWKLLAVKGNEKLINTGSASLLKGSYSLKKVLATYLQKNEYEISFSSLAELAYNLM